MNDDMRQAILSAVRSTLIAFGSFFVTKGYLDDATVSQLIGAFMVIVPLAWGIWDKYTSEQKTKVREVIAVNAGIAKSNADPAMTPPVVAVEEAKVVIEIFGPVEKGVVS